MAFADQYDLPLTTDSAAAAETYVDGLDLFLRGRVEAGERFTEALRHDPDFALPRAALAYHLQFESSSQAAVAQILVAARCAQQASRRERALIEAMRRAFVGDHPAACELIAEHLDEFPRDVLVVRQLMLLRGYGGDSQRRAKLADELRRLARAFGPDPWFLAVRSFILAECGEIELARRIAEDALADCPDHGHLAHSLAHTYFEANEDEVGLDFLARWLADHGDSFIGAGHLTWHAALCALALSQPERAWALYRDQKTGSSRRLRLEDSISLLLRLQLRGFDVGDEWQSALEREASAGPSRAFELAHLGLASAAIRDVDGVQRIRRQATAEATRRPHQPFRFLIPLLDALELVAREQWADAARALENTVAGAQRLGGSNEQHMLFDEMLFVMYRRAGRERDARRVQRERLRGRRVEAVATA